MFNPWLLREEFSDHRPVASGWSTSSRMSPVIGQWKPLLQSRQWAPSPEDSNPSPQPNLPLLCPQQGLRLPSHCVLSLTASPFLKHHMSPGPFLTLKSLPGMSLPSIFPLWPLLSLQILSQLFQAQESCVPRGRFPYYRDCASLHLLTIAGIQGSS